MKKYINKLFEWLGYVPKIQLYQAKEKYLKVLLFDEMILKDLQAYIVREIPYYNCYAVTMLGVTMNQFHSRIVKSFPFSDDKEYAKLCAEELCEMLNQKI